MPENTPERKMIRHKGYDYRLPGCYFITVCTKDKQCSLGSIPETCVPELTALGTACRESLLALDKHFPEVTVDTFVIMPNHIHALLRFSGISGVPGAHSLSTVVSSFKVSVQNKCKTGEPLFQRSYYDRIVRNEAEYREIRAYILENPVRWRKADPRDITHLPENIPNEII